ncbi:MAG: diphthamide synthesis protein [Candidatus Pacearchaeota archaeon]|nr:diphthamide synthesis protein [Candidatus Pacearchaeota archaeon]
MHYDFEIGKIVRTIKKEKARTVCLQLPEGLKPEALAIAEEIESRTDAKCLIWLGSCYGACDLPNGLEEDVDLLIQFGHSPWKKSRKAREVEN